MTKIPPSMQRLLGVAALLITCSLIVPAQDVSDAVKRWEGFDFARDTIVVSQIAGLPLEDLQLLRGIIFGNHGRVFKDPAIKSYLKERSWYRPNPDFKNSMLNQTEVRNLDLIRDAEASKHEFLQPGDMRYWRSRTLTRRKLGQHTSAEWLVLRSEVEAIHGKRFDDQPWLQQYFDERYWYKPSDSYNSQSLTPLERKNMQTIASAESKQRRLAISPGDMEFFENKIITEQMLKGLSLHELRLLRNGFMRGMAVLFVPPGCNSIFGVNRYEQKEDFRTSKYPAATS